MLFTLQQYKQTIETVSDGLTFTIESVNDVSSEIMTRAMPLLAPLPSAVAVYMSLVSHLDYSDYVAIPAAVAIEGLGFSTADLAVKSWDYNRRTKTEDAPATLAIVMFVIYLVIALALILVLEIRPDLSRFAPGSFPFLTCIGALNLASSILLRGRVNELRKNVKRQVTNHDTAQPQNVSISEPKTDDGRVTPSVRRDKLLVLLRDIVSPDDIDHDKLGEHFGASSRTIRRDIEVLVNDKRLSVNGAVKVHGGAS